MQTHANFGRHRTEAPYHRLAERQAIEKAWANWCKRDAAPPQAVVARKVQDGEAFALLVQNPDFAIACKLDLVLLETEQVQTPYLPYRAEGVIDGITFDRLGTC